MMFPVCSRYDPVYFQLFIPVLDNFMIEHQELCLHKAGQNCLKCIGRCPVGAIGEDGIDRHRCFARLKVNINHTKALAGLEETTQVCGKCVVDLPCSIDPLGQQT